MKELHGRTALVTGGSGGIGGEICRHLARQGMNVVVSGRREDALAAVVAELRELGVKAEAVAADLGDLDQVEPLDPAQRGGPGTDRRPGQQRRRGDRLAPSPPMTATS